MDKVAMKYKLENSYSEEVQNLHVKILMNKELDSLLSGMVFVQNWYSFVKYSVMLKVFLLRVICCL